MFRVMDPQTLSNVHLLLLQNDSWIYEKIRLFALDEVSVNF